jgi:choline dehydrogenase-like flavoprotein
MNEPELRRGERPELTRWEWVLRGLAVFLALVSLTFAIWYLVKGIVGPAEFPYATNSVAKDALLVGLSLLVFWDVRRWSPVAVPLIVFVHLLMPVILVVTALWGSAEGFAHTWYGDPFSDGPSQFRVGWLIVDVAMATAFIGVYFMATRSRYDMRFLTPAGFRALMALAEVLVLREDRQIAPAEVAVRVDHYLARFRARGKFVVCFAFLGLAYLPVFTLHPPFHVMSVNLRERWVRRRFLDETWDWLTPRFLRDLRRAMIRAAQQFCFFGYYGDPRAAKKAGYVPFSKRYDKNYQALLNKVDAKRPRVECMRPADISGETITVPLVVVGTGAGGAMLAYELARRGREVLLLEQGKHVDPSAFTEDEGEQLSNLYADGALTMSKDFRFQVAQGMCVGGSTVVNNAVCFDLPREVLRRWNGLEYEAGLDVQRLDQAFDDVRDFLKVKRLKPKDVRNPGAQHLVDQIKKVASADGRRKFKVVECNMAHCLGSGYCNIGCRFGRKLSALDHTLPCAQRTYRDRVRILPECRVKKVLTRGRRAYGVRARLGDGRRLTVQADTVVLSAGAIASSLILQRSNLGEGAGKRLAFNMASPVTLDFEEKLHSERGAQISHAQYLKPTNSGDRGLAVETWFNPIVAQSLFMPGWFDEHRANMRRYKHMTCLGVVVGTESNGRVKATLTGGVDLSYEPTNCDFVKLKDGVRLACKIGLEAGALRALPSTFRMLEINRIDELGRIDSEIGSSADISINSAHPQGGNPMSSDPKKGVVDPTFRVYGTENVYVCDASVFPSSITVNPQLTVMALAAYAAEAIAGKAPPPSPSTPSMSHAGASGPGS